MQRFGNAHLKKLYDEAHAKKPASDSTTEHVAMSEPRAAIPVARPKSLTPPRPFLATAPAAAMTRAMTAIQPRHAGRAERGEGERDRDELSGAGASPWRREDQPAQLRRGEGDQAEDASFAAELSSLRQFFAAKIEIARRVVAPADRAAAIKELRREQRAAMRAITERRGQDRAATRRHRRQQLPDSGKPGL